MKKMGEGEKEVKEGGGKWWVMTHTCVVGFGGTGRLGVQQRSGKREQWVYN